MAGLDYISDTEIDDASDSDAEFDLESLYHVDGETWQAILFPHMSDGMVVILGQVEDLWSRLCAWWRR